LAVRVVVSTFDGDDYGDDYGDDCDDDRNSDRIVLDINNVHVGHMHLLTA
jgi:hypothetical protein